MANSEKTGRLRFIVRGALKRNFAGWLFILGISFLCMLILLFFTVSKSVLNELNDSKKDVYGEFTSIYYDSLEEAGNLSFTEDQIRDIVGGFRYLEYGCFYSVQQIVSEEGQLVIGYADNTALRLGRIQVLEGSMPQRTRELAATKTALELLECVSPKVGETIMLNGEEYLLSGIIQEYGRLWPIGAAQVEAKVGNINIFLTEEDSHSLFEQTNWVQRKIVFTQNIFESSGTIDSPGFFANANVTDEQTFLQPPDQFLIILMMILMLLLYNMRQMSMEQVRYRVYVYRILGMGRNACAKCLAWEAVIQTGTGLLLGNVGFIALSRLAVYLLGKQMGKEIPLILETKFILFINLIAVLYAVLLTGLLIFRVLGVKKPRKQNGEKLQEARKIGFRKLLFWEFQKAPQMFLNISCLVIISATFLSYTHIYSEMVAEDTQFLEVEGKMPYDYDYEYYTLMRYPMSPYKPGDIGDIDNYEHAGFSDQKLEGLKKIDQIREVKAYKANNRCFVIKEHDMDQYLDHKDGIEDGFYDILPEISAELAELFQYDLDQLIATSILGYEEQDLLRYTPYVTEGEINLEALNAGKEIVLVVPAHIYAVEYQPDGSEVYARYPTFFDREGAVNDTLFHVGEEVTLSELAVKNNYNGTITKEQALDNLERTDTKVKIGAIIRYKVGWFDNSSMGPTGHYFITTNAALDQLGMDVTYNRVRVYADTDADYEKLTAGLLEYKVGIPDMVLQDIHNELTTFHTLQYVTELSCGFIMLLVFGVSTICILLQLYSKAKLNRKRYAQLRISGLSIRRLGVLAGIQLLLILGGGGIVLYPILHKLLDSQGIDVINLEWEKACQYIGGPILAAYALTIFAGGIILVIKTTHKFGLCEDLTIQDH